MDKKFTDASTIHNAMVDAMAFAMQGVVKRAFVTGAPPALRYTHCIQDDPRILAESNHRNIVPILFGFSKSHTVGSATISKHDSEPDVVYFNMVLPPHQGSRESMHLKLYQGLDRGALKPVAVILNGIIQYIALAHPAFESDVIDIEEVAEIYAPTIY